MRDGATAHNFGEDVIKVINWGKRASINRLTSEFLRLLPSGWRLSCNISLDFLKMFMAFVKCERKKLVL